MSLQSRPEMMDSIDEVIVHRGQSMSPQQLYLQRNSSNVSTNMTSPLSRHPTADELNTEQRNASRPSSAPRRGLEEQHDASFTSRGSSHPAGASRDSMSRNGENTGTTAATIGGAVGRSANLADFFSSEVFNIVIHNPTTAHRFLRFCQSRACGENMEFLQKVSYKSCYLYSSSKVNSMLTLPNRLIPIIAS